MRDCSQPAHPGDVAGLVFVDGYHESWDAAVGPEALASFITARLRLWRFVGLLAWVGVVRLLGGRLESLLGRDYRHMPEAERARYVAMLAERRALKVAGDELRHGGDSSDALRSASLGDLPLVVITHGLPFRDEMQEQAWQGSQAEMAARSSRGRLVRAERSAHSVMIAEPQVVLDAIGGVIRER